MSETMVYVQLYDSSGPLCERTLPVAEIDGIQKVARELLEEAEPGTVERAEVSMTLKFEGPGAKDAVRQRRFERVLEGMVEGAANSLDFYEDISYEQPEDESEQDYWLFHQEDGTTVKITIIDTIG